MDKREEIVELMARAMHDAYEKAAAEHGWATQESCRVPFDLLPTANIQTMFVSVRAALSALEQKGYAIVPVEPSEEMIHVGGNAVDGVEVYGCQDKAVSAYTAMLSSFRGGK